MKYNPYYNKSTMNLKQLTSDLEKQGFVCKISDDDDYLCVTYFRPFNMTEFYRASTNWEVVKLLKKTLDRSIN